MPAAHSPALAHNTSLAPNKSGDPRRHSSLIPSRRARAVSRESRGASGARRRGALFDTPPSAASQGEVDTVAMQDEGNALAPRTGFFNSPNAGGIAESRADERDNIAGRSYKTIKQEAEAKTWVPACAGMTTKRGRTNRSAPTNEKGINLPAHRAEQADTVRGPRLPRVRGAPPGGSCSSVCPFAGVRPCGRSGFLLPRAQCRRTA